jgi:hypothetical protein
MGVPTSYTNTPLPVNGYYRWRYYAGYFQDDWRFTNRITLNLGLRYAVETPRTEKFNNQAYLVAGASGTTPNGLPANVAFCFSGTCGLHRTMWPINFWGLEPRIGISAQLTPKTTIRASYTLVHMPLSGYNNSPDPSFNLPGSQITSTSGGLNPTLTTDLISNPIGPIASSLASLVKGANYYSPSFAPEDVDQNTAVPYMQSYSLAVQFQPLQKTLVQITYQGTKGVHLIGPNVASNVPTLSQTMPYIAAGLYFGGQISNPYGIKNPGTTAALPETASQLLNPYQSFFNQALNHAYQRNGILNYNALYVSMNQRLNKYVSFLASYTWSKQLDDIPNATAGTQLVSTNVSGVQDPINRKGDYSVSAFDQANRFKLGYNARLPFGAGQRFSTHRRWVNNLIGGFSTSGIVGINDGLPNFVTVGTGGYFYSISALGKGGLTASTPAGTVSTPGCTGVTGYCNSNGLPGGYSLRPNRVPGQPLINPNWKKNPYNAAAPGGITPYLNMAAFAIPGAPGDPQLGNVPRFMADARSPRQFICDMSFSKAIQINKRFSGRINVNMNDIFNHAEYNGVMLTGHTLLSSAGISTTTGLYPTGAIGDAAGPPVNAAFGNLNGGNLSRIIRIGAELNF